MQQFLQISQNITRCTYTPTDRIQNTSLFIDPEKMKGKVVSHCPIDVREVAFFSRDIYKSIAGDESSMQTVQTADGLKTVAKSLESVYDRQGVKVVLRIAFLPEEHIYGLGQDEDGVLDKRGHIEYLYQHNMRIPIPMFVSDRGYGVLFNCACLMVFDDTQDVCQITLECVDQLDFYVITGSMDDIVAAYRYLTGTATAMPDWVLGYWQSKERYKDQWELLRTAERYREEGVPLDVIVQDWNTWKEGAWGEKHLDRERYPNFGDTLERLHAMNVHGVISVWPNTAKGGKDHTEFAERGMLLADLSTYNAFDPQARALYWKQAEEELFSAGIDGWWCDSTEPFTDSDWCGTVKLSEKERYALVGGAHERYLDPSQANAYSLVHAQGIFENQPCGSVVNLTRAGWAGIQKYGVILWAGDTCANWRELKREIAKGLNMGMSGIPYWTVDAGAFFVRKEECWFLNGDYDGGVEDLGYQELYTRWLQFACFLPIFRSHGTDTPREFWNFKPPFCHAIKETIRLRYRLMPYIKEMFRKVHEEHFTVMRSLLFDFAQDERVAMVDDEFMFGSDLLVCPVTEPQFYTVNSTPVKSPSATRVCYLPSGADWYDFYTGDFYRGGQSVSIPTVIDRIPLFVKAGSEIPTADGMQHAQSECSVTRLRFPCKKTSVQIKDER